MLKQSKLFAGLLLGSALMLSACNNSEPVTSDLENMPKNLTIIKAGNSVDQIKLANPIMGMNHGNLMAQFGITNNTSKDIALTYATTWKNSAGFILGGNSKASIFIKHGTPVTVIVPAPNARARTAVITINSKPIYRRSLNLNQNDYQDMITSVIDQFRAEANFDNRKATISIANFRNRTSNSTISVEDMGAFVTNALQSTGHFIIKKNPKDSAVKVVLSLSVKGGSNISNTQATYTVTLDTTSVTTGNTKKYNSVLTFFRK